MGYDKNILNLFKFCSKVFEKNKGIFFLNDIQNLNNF